jgi:hypothetical protein
MLDKDSTHCAILSLLAISAILLLWHIKQMGAKPTTTPAARLYGVGGSMLPARVAGLGVGMRPEKFAFAAGNKILNGSTLAEKAGMIGTAHLHTQSPIQSRVNPDNCGVMSAHLFGKRK